MSEPEERPYAGVQDENEEVIQEGAEAKVEQEAMGGLSFRRYLWSIILGDFFPFFTAPATTNTIIANITTSPYTWFVIKFYRH